MTTIAQDASASIVTPTELIVHTPYHDLAEYHGTRVMLEAEGVIPADTQWPKGYDELCWEDGQNHYRLHRSRPDGAKGPRKLFIDVDWWCFRFTPTNPENYIAREFKRKAKELADFAYRHSAKGQAESHQRWGLYWKAYEDEKFQAFKALFPGLVPPKRGRRPKSTEQSQGVAA